MQRFFTFFGILFFLLISSATAQLASPLIEAVYGGRINAMSSIEIDSNTSRLFISTESANSIFYADVNFDGMESGSEGFFPVPDANDDDNLGSGIQSLSADSRSGFLFFTNFDKLYGVSTTAGSRYVVADHGVQSFKAYNGFLFYLSNNSGKLELHFGSIDSLSGDFTESGDSPLTVASGEGTPDMGTSVFIHPTNKHIYVTWGGSPATIVETDSTYKTLTKTTSFSSLATTGMGSDKNYSAFGFAPDGRIYAGTSTGNEPNKSKFIAYTDDNGASWDTLNTGIAGIAARSFSFSGPDTAYYVYFGSSVGAKKGAAGNWKNIGWGYFTTHPNDGPVERDAHDPSMVYMTTDMGIGMSNDNGESIIDINDGVAAVQVNDFDMNNAKTDAWLASKSGIRRVKGYGGFDEAWNVFFPNGDGSPYYSIAMDKQHPDTAYAGNVRLYRTFDGGASWNQVFRTEDYWGSLFDFSSTVKDVAVHPDSSRFVILGVNSSSNGVKGAVFFSFDYGSTWDQVNTDVYNTEVNRLVINPVNADSFNVYVACDYVNDGTTSSYGVKRIGFSFSKKKATYYNDMIGETGGHVTNFGANDVSVSTHGDIIAAGYNSSNEPRVYGQRADSSYWMSFPTTNFPSQGSATASTWGFDASSNELPYVAIGNQLFAMDTTFSGWTNVYTYPVGTKISVLYWDDLLVGTGTGLYGQDLTTTGLKDTKYIPALFTLEQNYPNPFNPSTTIRYVLNVKSRVTLSIYDVLGRKIRTLANDIETAGRHQLHFDASHLANGFYFYRLKATSLDGKRHLQRTKRMLLLK